MHCYVRLSAADAVSERSRIAIPAGICIRHYTACAARASRHGPAVHTGIRSVILEGSISPTCAVAIIRGLAVESRRCRLARRTAQTVCAARVGRCCLPVETGYGPVVGV
jgi:hypothetical protein